MKIKDVATFNCVDYVEEAYTMEEALSYQSMLWTVKECVKEYGLQTVLFDIMDTIQRGGVE